ncbi:hypothetical protein C0993_000679 [Termitomyces sp. T159_Od127]|nr:hypothetical protein C0993_000679 [Termitomyces sp. T159_Od127]
MIQMSEENKNMQTALNEARNAKLAKEGEVTILRKNAEKAAHEHAAQLATLKLAREEADAKQARIQKDLREEAERLKTQLVFKHHEQESTLKPAPSVRSKKILKDASFTADSTPSHLRGQACQSESRGLYPMGGKSNVLNQTLDMPFGQTQTSMLPGFENAFNDATSSAKVFNQEIQGTQALSYKNGLRPSLGRSGLATVFPMKRDRPELPSDADVSMDFWVDDGFVQSAHGDIDMPVGTAELDSHMKVEEVDMDPTHTTGPSHWKVEPCDTGTSDSCILVYLSEIVLEHREMEKQDFFEALSIEVVTLLEALAYSVPPELVERLTYISYNRQVLMNLFRANQPPWLLARSVRLLVILASHHKLCRFLLSMPDPEISTEGKTADPQKIPLVERLCLYLIDAGRKDADYKEAKASILTFFALLSNSHADVHAHLLTSTTVIPSLVFFLAQLTAAFWEDDEELMSASSEEVSMAIQTLNQALFLLHHFVFTSVSFINLRQKLHAPYHRIFNGLMHMFIVAFGRLSYGEAPEWIHRQGRIDLVSSTDMARDILDHVVDGPEADRTWQAYQIEGETSNDTDEEEMEEQLLGGRI